MLVFEKDLQNIPLDIVTNMASNINPNYINCLLEQNNNLVFYSFDTNIDILNCPCCLIYKIDTHYKNTCNVFILFLATSYKYRKVGYASIFMREFIDYVKNKYIYKNVNIILDSVISSVTFYEYIGYKWVTKNTKKYFKDLNISKYDKNEHFIMIYKVH